MMMSYGNQIDVIVPNMIDDAERIPENDSFAEFSWERGPCFRVERNSFYRLLDG
jgi:hypothetical protein